MEYDDKSFRNQIPQYADQDQFPTASIQIQFDIANAFISTDTNNRASLLSEKDKRIALNYLTAHLYSLMSSDSTKGDMDAPGVQTGASIGDVSVSYQIPTLQNDFQFWLMKSKFGQALLAFLKGKGAGGFSKTGLPETMAFRRWGGF